METQECLILEGYLWWFIQYLLSSLMTIIMTFIQNLATPLYFRQNPIGAKPQLLLGSSSR